MLDGFNNSNREVNASGMVLVVISTTDHFLTRLAQQDSLKEVSSPVLRYRSDRATYMFELRRERPIDIHQRRILLHNTLGDEVVHLHIN